MNAFPAVLPCGTCGVRVYPNPAARWRLFDESTNQPHECKSAPLSSVVSEERNTPENSHVAERSEHNG